eukprot:COSAG01_NODE_3989_length_5461_cov_21.135660_3_plen_247_part_00
MQAILQAETIANSSTLPLATTPISAEPLFATRELQCPTLRRLGNQCNRLCAVQSEACAYFLAGKGVRLHRLAVTPQGGRVNAAPTCLTCWPAPSGGALATLVEIRNSPDVDDPPCHRTARTSSMSATTVGTGSDRDRVADGGPGPGPGHHHRRTGTGSPPSADRVRTVGITRRRWGPGWRGSDPTFAASGEHGSRGLDRLASAGRELVTPRVACTVRCWGTELRPGAVGSPRAHLLSTRACARLAR